MRIEIKLEIEHITGNRRCDCVYACSTVKVMLACQSSEGILQKNTDLYTV